MKIYQNLGINKPEDADFSVGTIGIPYTIKSAQKIEKAYDDRNVLQMGLRESRKDLGNSLGYGLIGEEVFKPFMEEIGVDSVDALVGKEVFVFIPPRGHVVQGVAIRN